MRFVPLNCVPEGAYLAKNLFDDQGRILLREGTGLSTILIEKIRKSGFQTIYIYDEFSDDVIEDIVKPEIKIKAINKIKATFENIIKENESNGNRNKGFVKSPSDNDISSLQDISKYLVDELFASKDILINLIDIKNMDNYTYEHSLSVTILSLVLGIELKLNKNELYDLCIGALLHDIGKAFIPKEIIRKEDTLTAEEFKLIKEHTTKGYEYLKGQVQLSAPAKIITLQHHEKFDGSGYPSEKTGEEINKLARIVAIADVYDAMTSDRPYKKAQPPNEAIEYIMGSAGRHFDFNMTQAFIRRIIPYPVGTLIRLSNGAIAIVDEINKNFPLRPKIKIIEQRATTVNLISVDLLKEKTLVIEGVQYDIPNPSVQNYLKNK